MKGDLIAALKARGFIDQVSHDDLAKKLNEPIKAYIGFDPTADSLHLGNLVGVVLLKWFEKYGHTPVVLLGGATGKIGDPSGKDKERPLLSKSLIEANVAAIANQLGKWYERPIALNNDDWFKDVQFIDFLRDVGKHFRMGPMLAKESVKRRIGSDEGMSFTEFSYQILQGYDFYHLFKHHEVVLQMGGSDQWGNITAGIEISRKLGKEQVYGLVHPLLTRSDGKKFGKSEDGAVWLDPKKVSPYKFYQYLIGVPDQDVTKLMRLLTFMELEEIEEFDTKLKNNSLSPNEGQKRLAEEITRFVHGDDGLKAALDVTKVTQPGKGAKLSLEAIENIASDMPNVHVDLGEFIDQELVDLVAKSGFLASKGEARRLIKGGGAYLNNEPIENPAYKICQNDLIGGRFAMFAAGKKRKLLFVVESKKNT